MLLPADLVFNPVKFGLLAGQVLFPGLKPDDSQRKQFGSPRVTGNLPHMMDWLTQAESTNAQALAFRLCSHSGMGRPTPLLRTGWRRSASGWRSLGKYLYVFTVSSFRQESRGGIMTLSSGNRPGKCYDHSFSGGPLVAVIPSGGPDDRLYLPFPEGLNRLLLVQEGIGSL